LSSHRFEVNRCCVHLDIVERKLRALRKDPSIECDQRASIVVETISVAALLICVEIDTPELPSASETERTNLLRSFLDEIYPSVQFTQLVMTARRVCEDFHPVQTHIDVRAVDQRSLRVTDLPCRCKQLFAHLDTYHGIFRRDDGISERDGFLPSVPGYRLGRLLTWPVTLRIIPGRECSST